ncbi:MAG TPA: ammonia channel protein, partial [Blastocatellia bacterium]|nr:ammonia channel protein [Blastocatellia bacterium]
MRPKTLLLRAIFALTGCLTIVSVALGQTIEERLATAEANVKAAQTAGDNAWMLASSALVLLMTGPGLALFYGGLV